MTSIFLLSFLYDLVDFISILSPCDTLVRKLMYVRQRVESASKIRFPSSWIGLIDSRSVTTAVSSPPFENASVPIAIPALPRSVLPRDFKNSFCRGPPTLNQEVDRCLLDVLSKREDASFPRASRSCSLNFIEACISWELLAAFLSRARDSFSLAKLDEWIYVERTEFSFIFLALSHDPRGVPKPFRELDVTFVQSKMRVNFLILFSCSFEVRLVF